MFFRADYLKQTTVLIGQKEGLPNISGTQDFRGLSGGNSINLGGGSGAFSGYSFGGSSHTQLDKTGTGSAATRVTFDASRSNSIYGANAHVTPVNATIKVWQRVS